MGEQPINRLTNHKILIGNSADMKNVDDDSVDLVVTSPPYPMIEMWDTLFSSLNTKIKYSIEKFDGQKSFTLMHEELNKTWYEVSRVVKPGGIICINIGDATRTLNGSFQLYSNHSKVIDFFSNNGFSVLPDILWRKQSNKPNKFMGSGMLPPNAYATLEHEYILIFKKGKNRTFTPAEKKLRSQSVYFYEERNNWFSDLWTDLKGITQKMNHDKLRERSAAYPFELVYRLISMYSIIGDTVLDPFWGTGTTTLAAMSSARNSIGYEVDHQFLSFFKNSIKMIPKITHERNKERITTHISFIRKKESQKYQMKYSASHYGFSVLTAQERDILFYDIEAVKSGKNHEYHINHKPYKYKIQQHID